MRKIAQSRTGVWLAKMASLVTLLALVVAPACAPLCAAQTCAQGAASTEMGSNCHSHGMINGGTVIFHASQSCGSSELQAANLPSADKRGSLQKVRAAVSFGALGVLPTDCSSPSARNSAFIGAELELPPHFCFAIHTVVLRI
jgi:hypothetical protein